MFKAWIVANRKDLVKTWNDKIFHDKSEALEVCNILNNNEGKIWKVYEIEVEIK